MKLLFGRRKVDEPSVRVRRLEQATGELPTWRLPWPVMAGLAALVTAATGWVLVTGFCVLGWITVPQIKVVSVLQLGTQGWLLVHGVPAALPGAQLSIMPLGLTALVIAVGLGLLHQAVVHSPAPPVDQLGMRTARMGAVFGIVYVVVLTIARSMIDVGQAGQSSMIGAIVLVFGLGLLGSARALKWSPRLPLWLRAGGLAVVAGVCVLLATGAVVVITALISGRDRIVLVHDALQPGTLGGVMLMLGQLAWLPNFILWGGAWSVGAGVQLGLDTVISPAQSWVGMLPAIPVLGAVPPAGPMARVQLLWLLGGVLAGVAAAVVLVGALQRAAAQRDRVLGIDLAAIFGALAGASCGLVFTLLQIPATGDLGSVRLVNLGAKLDTLLVMAPSTLGLAGMATGAVLGWLAARQRAADPDAEHDAEAEQATSVVADRRVAAKTDE